MISKLDIFAPAKKLVKPNEPNGTAAGLGERT